MDIYGFHILKLITTTIDIYCFILKIKLKIYITIYLSSYPNWKKYIKNFFLFISFIKITLYSFKFKKITLKQSFYLFNI